MNPNIDEIFETLSENTLEKVFKLMGESKVFRANIDTKKLAFSDDKVIEKKNPLLVYLKLDKKYLHEFMHILLHLGEDEIVKKIDQNDKFFIDLYDPNQFENKFKFSFDDEIPKDTLKYNNKEASNSGGGNVYPMSLTPRGICYIINNYFTIGTYKETQRLRNIIKQLHFQVIIEKNKSINEILDNLKNYAKSYQQNDYDAFMFMIISYKNKNNELVDLENGTLKINELIEIFNDDNCPKMKEKPRVFFFNLCSSTDTSDIADESEALFSKYTGTNILVCRSTFDFHLGYVNWAMETHFGRAIANSLVEKASYRDINQIIVRANSSLVKKFGERARKLIKWTALSRTLYFYHKDFDPKISDTSEGHTSLENFINKMGKYLKNEELLELVKQVTKGLKVLHSYEMFHSEINPKNIEVCVSQTNKGKVYKIENIESYQNEVRCWKSPESLNSGLKGSYEDDIFSLGCIIYFIVSEGKHPFNFQQSNILTYKPELSALKNCQNRDKNGFYINLIKEMIKADHKERPTIDEVSNHPLFWDTDKLMNFFRKVTNFIRKYENQALDGSINISSSQQEIEVVITNLTKKRNEIYKKDNWFEELCPTVQNFEIKRIESKDEKEKKFRLCKDRASLKKLIELHRLIHYIVDKERHLREWPIEIKEGEHFLDYFTERFPNLLICSYDCFKILKDESLLKSFY